MAHGHYKFEDLTAIIKETLQIIGTIVPTSVATRSPHQTKADANSPQLHKFPRYVFEELHNLEQLVQAHQEPVFAQILSQMAVLKNICKTLDPSLDGKEDGEITPIVIEPSHLDLIRSVLSNLEFSLLGMILSRGRSFPGSSTDGDASA